MSTNTEHDDDVVPGNGEAADAEPEHVEPERHQSEIASQPMRQWQIISVVAAAVVASLYYWGVSQLGLQHSALLFIGLPTVIALVVALMPTSHSAVGVSLQATTLFLVIATPLFKVPMIGVIVAAPLFYLMSLLIGLLFDRSRKRAHTDAITYALLLMPFAIMSLEGISESLSFGRNNIVTTESVVMASAAEVEAALAEPPQFDQELPFLLSLGFPRPVSASGSGLQTGAQRRIRFDRGGGEAGELLLEVTIRRSAEVRFEVVEDRSQLSQWIRWKRANVFWYERSPGETVVRWQLEYDRLLDPSWYFSLWQQYCAVLAADYLIETGATPEE